MREGGSARLRRFEGRRSAALLAQGSDRDITQPMLRCAQRRSHWQVAVVAE